MTHLPLLLFLAALAPLVSPQQQECGAHVSDDGNPLARILDDQTDLSMQENRLIGGVETSPHSWPWTVQLVYMGGHRCGGALIGRSFVVTAAHCFARSRLPERYTVFTGGHTSMSGQEHKVLNITVHPLFNVVWPSSFDVALIKIAPEVTLGEKTQPICLPLLPPLDNKMCVVAGWGLIHENGTKSTILREIHVPIVPLHVCNNFNHYSGRIHAPTMVCAGYSQGRIDSCQGDSGGPLMCEHAEKWDHLRDIVFIAQMPHARGGLQLEYSPWMQFLLGLMQVEVEYSDLFEYVACAKLMLEVRMGVRTANAAPTDWQEYAATNVTRTLECTLEPSKRSPGNTYQCETLDLFELGANNYPTYLLNVRIPIDRAGCERFPVRTPNCRIGMIKELHMVAIHQNGGFTLVWLWLKTALFPLVIAALYWFNHRLSLLPRQRLLLERAIMALGAALAVLDAPLEWASLFFRTPCLLLLSDLRQGLFYSVLFSFWLIFVGEHSVDDPHLNDLSAYRINLSLVGLASAALLVYDMAERGMQLADPFYSIWSSETGTAVAYVSIYVALACTLAYFAFLFYKIVVVWNSIRRKRAAHLYRTSENRRLKVEGVIYRFKFLMLFTLLCSALTIAAYFMRQFGEAADDSVLTHSTSAFFTGTFGMWNIYVLLLIAMYAPSHMQYQGAHGLIDENEDLMSNGGGGGETAPNPLTTFLKPATD